MIPWNTDEGKHSSAEPLSFKFLLRKRFYRNIGGDERRKLDYYRLVFKTYRECRLFIIFLL